MQLEYDKTPYGYITTKGNDTRVGGSNFWQFIKAVFYYIKQ